MKPRRHLRPVKAEPDPAEQLGLDPAELQVLKRTLQTLQGGGDARLLTHRREFQSMAAKVARRKR